jgi:large subunit ribosomal protein L6
MAKTVHLKEEIPIPENVKIEIDGKKVKVNGPRGNIERDFSFAPNVLIKLNNSKLIIETFFANRKQKAVFYAIVSHIKNMIIGVTRGWRYRLKIVSTHFPVTVKVSGNEVLIENFLGERSPRKAKILEGVKVKVEGKDIIVEGIDIEKVAQTAANIEISTHIRDKDRRVFVDGIYIYESGEAE